MTRQIQKKEGEIFSDTKRKSFQQKVNKLNKRWKNKINKQKRVIAALKADSRNDSDKDEAEPTITENKKNKRVRFNSGVTQRTHTDQNE